MSRPRVRPADRPDSPVPTWPAAPAPAGQHPRHELLDVALRDGLQLLMPEPLPCRAKRVRVVPGGGVGERPALPSGAAAQDRREPLVEVLVQGHLGRAHIPAVAHLGGDLPERGSRVALLVVGERLLLALLRHRVAADVHDEPASRRRGYRGSQCVSLVVGEWSVLLGAQHAPLLGPTTRPRRSASSGSVGRCHRRRSCTRRRRPMASRGRSRCRTPNMLRSPRLWRPHSRMRPSSRRSRSTSTPRPLRRTETRGRPRVAPRSPRSAPDNRERPRGARCSGAVPVRGAVVPHAQGRTITPRGGEGRRSTPRHAYVVAGRAPNGLALGGQTGRCPTVSQVEAVRGVLNATTSGASAPCPLSLRLPPAR